MPRARAHITSLIEQHHRQVERIAELEALIAEATNGGGSASQPAPPSPSPAPPAGAAASKAKKLARPKMSIDDALKAEEAALRELEAETRALKASLPAQDQGTDESEAATASSSSSPPRRTITTLDQFGNPVRTPGRTPRAPGSIGARSLFQGPPGSASTPGRTRASLIAAAEDGHPIDRFSPLKLLSTPRTAQRASLFGTHASLRKTARPSEGRFLFTKPMPTPQSGAPAAAPRASLYAGVGSSSVPEAVDATPVAGGSEEDDDVQPSGEAEQEDDDQTVRFGQYHAPEGQDQFGAPTHDEVPQRESELETEHEGDEPEPSADEEASAKVISGVEVELPSVEIACVSTLSAR